MGISGSRYCKENIINQDLLTVITLTDSLVRRLPLDSEHSTPLEREMREQNVDDFWKDRMECLENAYVKDMGLTEETFDKMEKRIIDMSPPLYRTMCPLMVIDVERCLASFPNEPLRCNKIIQKLMLCIDTKAQDDARRACLKAARESKKKICPGK